MACLFFSDKALSAMEVAVVRPVQNSLSALDSGGDVVIAPATDRIPERANKARIVGDQGRFLHRGCVKGARIRTNKRSHVYISQSAREGA